MQGTTSPFRSSSVSCKGPRDLLQRTPPPPGHLGLLPLEPGRQDRAHREGPGWGDQLQARKKREPREGGAGEGRGRAHPPLLPPGRGRAEAPLFPASLVSPHGAPYHCHCLERKTRCGGPGLWGLGTVRGTSPAPPPLCHLRGLGLLRTEAHAHKHFLCTPTVHGALRELGPRGHSRQP